MADWVKLSTDIFDNQKIKFVRAQENGDTMALLWIWLISRAGMINDQGRVYFTQSKPYTPKTLAMLTGFAENIVRESLELFRELDMVDVDEDGYINILGWEEHQNIEGLEKIKEQTKARVQKHRAKQKSSDSCNVTGNVTETKNSDSCNVTERYSNVTVTQQNREEKNREDKSRVEAAAEAAAAPCDPVFTLYESEIGPLTPTIGEELRELTKEVGEVIVKRAIIEAVKSGGRSFKYIQSIADRMHSGRDRPKIKNKNDADSAYLETLAALGVSE